MIIDSHSFYILPWSTIIGNMNPMQLKAKNSLLQCGHCNFIYSALEWFHHGKTKHLWCLQYIGHYAHCDESPKFGISEVLMETNCTMEWNHRANSNKEHVIKHCSERISSITWLWVIPGSVPKCNWCNSHENIGNNKFLFFSFSLFLLEDFFSCYC
jgi:hypothetical protein